jgi:UDP-2,3-diacylglucosamine pyrophosphatase LpxH
LRFILEILLEIIIYSNNLMNSQMKQAFIVVSDLHFGSGECNHDEFCSFLGWICGLENQPETVEYKDKNITIENPDQIILLGDILELWNPKNGDRGNIVKDSMRPLTLLSNINCDKIYVLGNHDDSLDGLEGKVGCETLVNGTKFYIYSGHYPKKDKKSGVARGLKIGNRSYFFLHGHQFDKKQAIIKLINKFWDPLDWFQDIFHIKFTKKHWKVNFVIFLCLLLSGKYLLWGGFLQSSFLSNLVWAMFTGFFALSSIPGIVANTQGNIYNSMKPRDKTAEQVIKNKYYQKSKETIDADVVVFGHTHFASSYELKSEARNKLFLNSGCWVGKDKDINGIKCYANTFIYLDETGAYILTWRGPGKIECIEAFT